MKRCVKLMLILAGVISCQVFLFSAFSHPLTPPPFVKNLSAPPLGVTSSSVILLWDDFTEPDLQQTGASLTMWRYDIFQDGVKIGTTNRRTFRAQELIPQRAYVFAVSCNTANADPSSLETIQVTTKAAGKVFNVRDLGAAGDGKKLDTEAIQKTIAACSKGGTVLLPAGTYLVDHLDLKSDMTLELVRGATLLFQGFKEGGQYPETTTILPGPDGDIHYQHRDLISGVNVHNVVITGEGTVDANGDAWWPYFPGGTDRVDGVSRPHTMEWVASSNILVQGVTFQDPPAWNNHLVYVDNALYSNVKFLKVGTKGGRNGDGLNPEGARNITVAGCLFGNQDDSMALKSGIRGNKRFRSTEYITIRDCVFDGTAAPGAQPLGIAIGSETSGGVRHIRVKNCEFRYATSIMYIKTNRERPYAFVEDVRIENVTYINDTARGAKNRGPISLSAYYYVPGDEERFLAKPLTPATPVFRDIHFKNIIIVNTAGSGIYMSGLAESPIRNVSFDQVQARSRDGMFIENVEDLSTLGLNILPWVEQ